MVAHSTPVFALEFSKFDEYLLLTGGADGNTNLWDLRKLVQPVYQFKGHSNKVTNISWNNLNETIFATSSEDGTIRLWDLSKINDQTCDSVDNVCFFVHYGHQGVI